MLYFRLGAIIISGSNRTSSLIGILFKLLDLNECPFTSTLPRKAQVRREERQWRERHAAREISAWMSGDWIWLFPGERWGILGGGSSPVQSSQPCRMAKAFLHCKLLLVRFVPGIALLLARQGKCRGRPGIYCMSIEQNIVFTRFN